MKTQTRPTLFLVLTLAAFPAAAVVRAEVTETFSQNFQLAPGGTISLVNPNGPARFVSAPEGSNEVRVEGVKRAGTAEAMQAIAIAVDARAEAVRVTTRLGADGTRNAGRVSVDYTITAPRGAKLEGIKLSNGSLTLEGLTTAGLEASCVNGRLVASDLAATGPITLGDVNGSMEVSLRALPGAGQAVNIKNVNGSVRVALPAGASVDLSAKTVNGSVSNDAGLTAEEGKSLVGRLGNGGTPMRVSTVNGSISVTTRP